jgi:hypothetical protein
MKMQRKIRKDQKQTDIRTVQKRIEGEP